MIPLLCPGWDIVLIARKRLVESSLTDVINAMNGLLPRAELITPPAIPKTHPQSDHVR